MDCFDIERDRHSEKVSERPPYTGEVPPLPTDIRNDLIFVMQRIRQAAEHGHPYSKAAQLVALHAADAAFGGRCSMAREDLAARIHGMNVKSVTAGWKELCDDRNPWKMWDEKRQRRGTNVYTLIRHDVAAFIAGRDEGRARRAASVKSPAILGAGDHTPDAPVRLTNVYVAEISTNVRVADRILGTHAYLRHDGLRPGEPDLRVILPDSLYVFVFDARQTRAVLDVTVGPADLGLTLLDAHAAA